MYVRQKRTIVIPKDIAEKLNIDVGTRLLLKVYDDKIEIKPLPDAVTISLKGKKLGKITLKELEEESIIVQEEYENKT
ncbi:AbrB/MazE/SpoVT family DNA-binding domain-containing protein [Caldisphaera sp.]|uniref:AbrB/MazE/SpoVT family DNA-binding domain-containing protein n=1 Tax=Caldisphaera sp. TaxID=2060322 RepID=UPI00345B94F5